MKAVDLIRKTRDGIELAPAEIDFLVQGYARGELPDYQLAAWCMAVYLRGLTPAETARLTAAMAASGRRADLGGLGGPAVDKHSTGGVGDKTTLVVAPLVASLGVPVAKMSGRALGHTGGTVDKLESIPGLRTALSREAFRDQVRRVGLAVAGQSDDLAPADRRLYALRDVTATVESLPLIAASIMSKKLAGGARAVVLDVKTGKGAFLPSLQRGRTLARLMVDIAERAGLRATALLTQMNQPLGHAVGNALEVREAIWALRDEGPPDLRELALALGAEMVVLGGRARRRGEARQRLVRALRSGEGLGKLRAMVKAQGGDPRVVDDPDRLPLAEVRREVTSPAAGWVCEIDPLAVAQAVSGLGAGRARKEDPIDHGVGAVVRLKVGDRVEAGQPVAEVYARSAQAAARAARALHDAVRLAPEPVAPLPVLLGRVRAPRGRF